MYIKHFGKIIKHFIKLIWTKYNVLLKLSVTVTSFTSFQRIKTSLYTIVDNSQNYVSNFQLLVIQLFAISKICKQFGILLIKKPMFHSFNDNSAGWRLILIYFFKISFFRHVIIINLFCKYILIKHNWLINHSGIYNSWHSYTYFGNYDT